MRHNKSPYPTASRDRLPRDPELRCTEECGRVLNFQTETRIRSIRAVAFHCVRICHLWERRRNVVSANFPKGREHSLAQAYDIVTRNERALDIDLRKLRLPIRAQVLVSKATRDLKIPVVAGDHHEL